jgi:hypothetical protein
LKGEIILQSFTIEVDDPESRLRIPSKFRRSCAIKMAQFEEITMVLANNEEEDGLPEVHPRDPVRNHSRVLLIKSKAIGSILMKV